MKPPELNQWQSILLGILIGAVIIAAAFVISLPDRSVPLKLLPTLTQAPVLVHVSGAVKSPGVVQVIPGSRVQDVINAAGGFLPEADQNRANLAAVVIDGQKIQIPVMGEEKEPDTKSASKSLSGETESTLISLNTASQKELESLPGIGQEKAKDIIAEREKRGGFQSVDDLLQIDGFSAKLMEQIKPLVYIE